MFQIFGINTSLGLTTDKPAAATATVASARAHVGAPNADAPLHPTAIDDPRKTPGTTNVMTMNVRSCGVVAKRGKNIKVPRDHQVHNNTNKGQATAVMTAATRDGRTTANVAMATMPTCAASDTRRIVWPASVFMPSSSRADRELAPATPDVTMVMSVTKTASDTSRA